MSKTVMKYQQYAEYKDSGVQWIGEIPQTWSFLRGKWKFRSLKEVNRNLQCMERLALTLNGVIERSIDSDEGLQPAEFSGYQIFEKNDLVFKLIDLENFKTSRVGLVFKRGIMSPAYIRLQPFKDTDSKFFYYFYFDLYLRGIYNQIGGQGVRSALNATDLLEIEVCVPTVSEQRKIANFLDHETAKIDSLIEKQQQLIELLKEKRQAVISHAVTKGLNPDVAMKDSGVEWLGQVPEHWTVSKLKHFVNVVDCKHITAEFFDEGIPLASIGEVKGWKVNLSNAKLTNEKYYQELIDGNRKPQVGDIIYTRNATVGEASLVHAELPKFALGQDVCLIHIIQKLSSEYLLHFLKSEIIKIQLNSAMVGSTFKRINVDDIRNYVIVIPPIEEQECILKDLDQKIEKYDSLINFAVKQIQLMQERRTALISSAVTGKIDLRNWQHPNEAKTELSL